jgi:hypothetical protein
VVAEVEAESAAAPVVVVVVAPSDVEGPQLALAALADGLFH